MMKDGICTNRPERCEKAKSQEVQRALESRFVCSECSFRLRSIGPGSSGKSVPWRLIAAGLAGLVVLGGGGYFVYSLIRNHGGAGPTPSACPRENLDDFLTRKPSPDQLLAAGKSCRDSATVANNAELVALVARLCRTAGDAGKAEGALCLGELYDPKEAKAGRLGQMPAADFALAFDNYRHALDLGSTEARTKLTELRPFVEAKARDGDSEATRLIEKWPQ